jgi:cytosine/adenosine deaminase-related metal-dependent hydrolase
MRIIQANWILVCNEAFDIIQNGAIAFDQTIHAVDTLENIQAQYPSVHVEVLGKNSVLMPGLINAHVHLEFSANKTTLKYGGFMPWLNSVIQSREALIAEATQEVIEAQLQKMLKTGTTSIGAISSYGFDLTPCVKSAMNVVYFSEIIGSKPEMVDALLADFKAKVQAAIQHKSKTFIPAVAIHSTYSVHPVLVREVLKYAKAHRMPVTAHFLESLDEKKWLKHSRGGFVDFFLNFLNQKQSITTSMEFLEQFEGITPLSFTHCVYANKKELAQIQALNASINHCPTSNRLLTNSKLNLRKTKEIPLSLGTDGLSSNTSLSLFDELKNALMIHTTYDIHKLCVKLLKAATKNAANALGLNKGVLKPKLDADIIAFYLPDGIEDKYDVAMQSILHTKEVEKTIIGGIDA